MKPWFERVYHTEPPSEGDFEREHKSIELSDEEIVLRDEAIRAVDMKLKNGDFDLLPPYPYPAFVKPSETNPMMPESLEMADRITNKKEAKAKTKKTTTTKKAKV